MILTLGETMMAFNGPPDAPLSVGSSVHATFAGAESNVAIALARLGHPVRFVTLFGDDPFGRSIAKTLRGEGVDTSAIRFSPAHPTGLLIKNRRPGDEPEVFYYRTTSAFAHAAPDTFDPALWRSATAVYLTGITPALSPSCRDLFRHVIADAKAHNIPIWLDPNYRAKLWTKDAFRDTLTAVLPDLDAILPGLPEAEILTDTTDPDEAAHRLRAAGVKNIILKTGPHGATAYTPQGRNTAPPLPVSHVIDPIGAGDAFAAGYLTAHLDGLPPKDSLHRAHALAAAVVQTRGDWEGLPTRAELERILSQNREASR